MNRGRLALARGRLEIWLEGKKIRGGYALVRTQMGGGKRNWLLIKMRDECANPTGVLPRPNRTA